MEWLEQRCQYMGASDTPIAMGLSKWSTPWKLWAQKTGRIPLENSTSRPIEFGNHMEPLLLKMASEELGIELVSPRETWLLPECEIIAASLDGWSEEHRVVVECKLANVMDTEQWDELDEGTIPDLSTKVGNYYLQIQQQMLVADAKEGYFSICLNNQHRLIRVKANLATQSMIGEFVQDWWSEHVVGGAEPLAVDRDLWNLARQKHDKDVEIALSSGPEDPAAKLVDDYIRGSEMEKRGKGIKDAALAVMAQMASAAWAGRFTIVGTDGRERRGGWVEGALRFDEAAFKKAHPELYAEFKTKKSNSYWTLFSKGGKKG